MAFANTCTINVLENSTEKCTLLTPECPANFQYSCTDGWIEVRHLFSSDCRCKNRRNSRGQPVGSNTPPLPGSGYLAADTKLSADARGLDVDPVPAKSMPCDRFHSSGPACALPLEAVVSAVQRTPRTGRLRWRCSVHPTPRQR